MKSNKLVSIFCLGFCLLHVACHPSTSSQQTEPSNQTKKREKQATKSTKVSSNDRANILNVKGVDFYVYKHLPKEEQLQLWLKDDAGEVYKNIGQLKKDLSNKGKQLLFAMNAGMYTKENLPQGVYKSNGEQLAPLDTRTSGYGNFYMQPNGVFAFNDTNAIVTTSTHFANISHQYKNATQSGPMLVIEGNMHPKFNENSDSKYIRNGAGVTKTGEVYFVYSSIPVNFHHFATVFLSELKCTNALYLDGAISKLYLPQLGREDTLGNLGPLIGIAQ